MKKRRFRYFDHAATTTLDPRVFRAMKPYFMEEFGNPSNLYGLGRHARQAVGEATVKISRMLSCRPDEFVFTASATEADNLAIAGVARANKDIGNKLIVSAVEHKGILAVCGALKKEGFEVVELPVGKDGLVDLGALKRELDERTLLVSVTMADSETGTVQPVAEIGKLLADFRSRPGAKTALPFLHTDASQAALYLDLDVGKLGVDLMTLSSHKMHGPKGVGGLYVRRGISIQPIIYGGGQQGRLRSGTENVPAIVGFGEAVSLALHRRKTDAARVKRLRDRLERGIFKSIPKVVLNGSKTKRLPNLLNISVLDIEGEAMLLYLDELGIVVNTGSACNSQSLEPSYVLSALGNPYEFIHGSIRFSLGRDNTDADVRYVLKHLPEMVKKLRKISPLNLTLGQKEAVSDPRAFVGGQTPHFLRRKRKV